jgi:hypothetical protein
MPGFSGGQTIVAQMRAGGLDTGSFGGLGGVGTVALGFKCDRTSCRCEGDIDCNDMFGTNVCGPEASCYFGWLTGQWVCVCRR